MERNFDIMPTGMSLPSLQRKPRRIISARNHQSRVYSRTNIFPDFPDFNRTCFNPESTGAD